MALIRFRRVWCLSKWIVLFYMVVLLIGGFIFQELRSKNESSLTAKSPALWELSSNQHAPLEQPNRLNTKQTGSAHAHISVKPPAALNTENCSEWYKDTFDENLRVISEYPRGDVGHVLEKIKGGRDAPSQMMTSFPVIATAANSGFFGISQGLLKSIHTYVLPKYPRLKIIYYDLGLQPSQVEALKLYGQCEVRKFPFADYPPHVGRLKTYAWKPIIVQTLLMEYGWVWWMDSSVRFVTSDLDRALQYSIDNHVLFLTYGPMLSVAYHTDLGTMRFLGEDSCKFRPFGEIEATFVLFHYSDVTSILTETWCACALNEQCIAPPGSSQKLGCNANRKFDGRCHRFDQAVLSILLRRLYHETNDYPLVHTPFHIHKIMRGNNVPYFNELRNKKKL